MIIFIIIHDAHFLIGFHNFRNVGFTMLVPREMSELETKTPSLRYGCTLLTLLTGYEEYTVVMLYMHLRSRTQR